MTTPTDNHLVWIDLEMTGLDPMNHVILEIATIVTDNQLNIVAEGPNLAIHQPESQLQLMDAWCTKTHTESGLVARVRASHLDMAAAEQQTLEFLKPYIQPNTSPLCGNSIWKDRHFLCHHMPSLERFLHYRTIDVSTVKELARRWAPKLYQKVEKEGAHLALQDIRESIAELKYYQTCFFNLSQ